jgi:hypothetical protein
MAQEEQLKENLKMLHTGLRREKKTQIWARDRYSTKE